MMFDIKPAVLKLLKKLKVLHRNSIGLAGNACLIEIGNRIKLTILTTKLCTYVRIYAPIKLVKNQLRNEAEKNLKSLQNSFKRMKL